jgi:NADH-quinone oxidoreductase subunit C
VDVHELSVDADQWRGQAADLVAQGATMLDFLTAVDDPAAGEIELVLHVVDVARRRRQLLRTRIGRGQPRLDSIVAVYPGAAWHEREVHEMFGVRFDGNADLSPLLTDGTVDRPLLRTSPLPRRVATPWPGAVDPADRPATRVSAPAGKVAARPRSRLQPPGIPEEWIASDPEAGPTR